MASDEFWTIEDFGFTAVNESELEVAKQASMLQQIGY